MKVVVKATKKIVAKFRKNSQEQNPNLSPMQVLIDRLEERKPSTQSHQKMQEKNVWYLGQMLASLREEYKLTEQQYDELCRKLASLLDQSLIDLRHCILPLSEDALINIKCLRDFGPRFTYEVDFNGRVYHATVEKTFQPVRRLDKLVPHFV
ncbi:MAG: hypothetical protein Q4B28_01865 [bacterium]|nr:hypothetical protein [bacterium]